MRKAFCVLAVLMMVLPAMAATDTFKVTIDGSFNINDPEGVGNAGTSTSFRLSKANQHMGYMDWDGAVGQSSGQSLGSFTSGGINKAYLYVRAAMVDDWEPVDPNNPNGDWYIAGQVRGTIQNTAAIVTLRTGNTGNIVQDPGIVATNFQNNGDPWPDGMTGTTQSSAWRMAENLMPTGFPATGGGLYSLPGRFQGEAWKTPSTREVGWAGFNPGDEAQVERPELRRV